MDAFERDQVIRRVQGGESEAYSSLVVDLAVEVRCFVAAHAANLDMIEEVVQSAFVEAYLNIARYELSGTFASWVKGFARNLLRRELSDRARAQRSGSEALDALVANSALNDLDDSAVAEQNAVQLERLDRCLQVLTPRTRELLRRRFAEGVPLNRLAQHFKQSRAAIANALTRVRANLRTCMQREQAAAKSDP